jgi:VWFA-related protein
MNLARERSIIGAMSSARISAVWLALAAQLGLACGQATPRFQVSTEEVVMHVRFTDRYGRAVSDIRRDEVRILEDGEEQKLSRLFKDDEPFDVGLLLDRSPSTFDIQEGIRERSIDLVMQAPANSRLLVLTFDTQVYVDCDWTEDLQKAADAIAGVETNTKTDGTILYEGLCMAMKQKFSRETLRKALIVYTDGIDEGSRGVSAKESLDLAEESGILVYPIQYDSREYYRRLYSTRRRSRADPDYDPRVDDPDWQPPLGRSSGRIGGIFVGGPNSTDRDRVEYMVKTRYDNAKKYLSGLARVTSGRYFETPDVNALQRSYADIINELSKVYTVTYIPSRKEKDGQFHRVKIDVLRPGIAVTMTRAGYWAK